MPDRSFLQQPLGFIQHSELNTRPATDRMSEYKPTIECGVVSTNKCPLLLRCLRWLQALLVWLKTLYFGWLICLLQAFSFRYEFVESRVSIPDTWYPGFWYAVYQGPGDINSRICWSVMLPIWAATSTRRRNRKVNLHLLRPVIREHFLRLIYSDYVKTLGFIPGRGRHFSFHQRVHNGSRNLQVFSPIGVGGSFSGYKVAAG